MFDLYYAAQQHRASDELFVELGAHRLLSWILNKKHIAELVELKRAGKYTGKLFIDSGAFTAHRKETHLDVDEYIEFLNNIDDAIDLFAQIDDIPGTFGQIRTFNQIQESSKKSWDNYLYMVKRVKSPEKLLPVFHQDESIENYLDKILKYKINGKPIPYIGISSAKDKASGVRFEWYKDVYHYIAHSCNPNVKTHSFGTSSTTHLKRYRFTSSDATSWLQTAANGSIMTKHGIVKLSEKSINDPDNMANKDGQGETSFQSVLECIEEYGFNLEDLKEKYYERANFNIRYLQAWAKKRGEQIPEPVKVSKFKMPKRSFTND